MTTKEYFNNYWQQNKEKIKLQRREYAKTEEYKKLRQEQNKRYNLKKKERLSPSCSPNKPHSDKEPPSDMSLQ
jgi:hypothetical protein